MSDFTEEDVKALRYELELIERLYPYFIKALANSGN